MADAQRRAESIAIRGRRSQAERTARTRQQIVTAVFESIAAVGLARTTAVEITRRAGVTWGAVQHHFGGKDGMLIAAVEELTWSESKDRMETLERIFDKTRLFRKFV